MGFPPTTEN